jgi:transglutaminase-like putative cysteine protease
VKRASLTLTPLTWSSLVLAGGMLLHIDRLPLWVSAVTFALIAWRLTASTRAVSLPGKLVRALVALALVVAVFVQYRTLNGLAPGTALLILMTSIKLLETHDRRDQYIVVGGCLFLLLAACLQRQDLLRAPLYLLEVWLCCSALAAIGFSPEKADPTTAVTSTAVAEATGPEFDSRAAVLLAGRALLYAAPLALLLFVFFPRLPGGFWALPHSEDAETGLSDSMSPGSISQLSTSYEIAFRVKFAGAIPPPQERYWRGPVLHDFDGYTWKRRPLGAYRAQPPEHEGKAYYYRISLEPSQQNWWLSLDTVDQSPSRDTLFTYDYELISRDPVTEPTSYNAVSHTATRSTESLTKLARQVETQWAEGRNPRTLQFARQLRSQVASDGAYVDAVLKLFRTGGFVYSLTPPLLDYNSVDDFIFNSHSGFCGHYASAFVTLMRGAGIPARVVTGYLGGEWNPVGGYFVVRQSDAHSWAEVWLEARGWTRVDPTAVVEPERLTRGILDLLPDAGSAGSRMIHASPGIIGLLQRWDAMNTWWTDHVLKFDYRSQLNLLSRLGIQSPDLVMVGWFFTGALLTWLAWIAWQVGRSPLRARPDRLARAYARLCRKLARVGLPRSDHQGPLAYADAVSEKRPDLAGTVRGLLTRYAELRYGAARAESRTDDIAGFEREVARLSLGRAP